MVLGAGLSAFAAHGKQARFGETSPSFGGGGQAPLWRGLKPAPHTRNVNRWV